VTVLVFEHHSSSAFISSYATISSVTSLPLCNSLTQFYLSTLDLLKNMYPNATFCTMTPVTVLIGSHTLPYSMFEGMITKKGVVTKKKYKPVVLKVRPVITELLKDQFFMMMLHTPYSLKYLTSLSPTSTMSQLKGQSCVTSKMMDHSRQFLKTQE